MRVSVVFFLLVFPDNRCEFIMMSNFHGYNYDMKVMTMPSGHTLCVHEVSRLVGKNHALQCFALQKLGLSKDEMVIFKSMMVLTVGE